jgi:cytochrome o ubiquinol oxidase subunit III
MSVHTTAAEPYRIRRDAGEAAPASDPHRIGHGRTHFPGPAPKDIISGYGFWIFLLSDFVMFSAFFGAHAVLQNETAGGPSGRELFDLGYVAIETGLLLLSSFTCGLAGIGLKARHAPFYQGMMALTALFGAGFLAMEVNEFTHMVLEGNGPSRSAFLTSFFSLVGCHGLHVTVGLLWLLTMMAQIAARGFTPAMTRRFQCFSLFWHALDIIWVGVFTIVYLMGSGQ